MISFHQHAGTDLRGRDSWARTDAISLWLQGMAPTRLQMELLIEDPEGRQRSKLFLFTG